MGCFGFFSKGKSSDVASVRSERTLVEPNAASDKSTKLEGKPDVTGERLAALRKLMDEEDVELYLVPTDDAHATEYTAPSDQRRVWISAFTGSAGTAIVARDSAHLFADGRYHVQAAEQLDDNWTLHKVGRAGVLDWPAWLAAQAHDGVKIGMDPALISYASGKALIDTLKDAGAAVVFPERNLVDEAWGDDRPKPSASPVYEHELKYAGKPATAKLADVRKDLEAKPAGSAYLVSALDEVAWVLNLRGASIPCHPSSLPTCSCRQTRRFSSFAASCCPRPVTLTATCATRSVSRCSHTMPSGTTFAAGLARAAMGASSFRARSCRTPSPTRSVTTRWTSSARRLLRCARR